MVSPRRSSSTKPWAKRQIQQHRLHAPHERGPLPQVADPEEGIVAGVGGRPLGQVPDAIGRRGVGEAIARQVRLREAGADGRPTVDLVGAPGNAELVNGAIAELGRQGVERLDRPGAGHPYRQADRRFHVPGGVMRLQPGTGRRRKTEIVRHLAAAVRKGITDPCSRGIHQRSFRVRNDLDVADAAHRLRRPRRATPPPKRTARLAPARRCRRRAWPVRAAPAGSLASLRAALDRRVSRAT